jgi:hypothetical protein
MQQTGRAQCYIMFIYFLILREDLLHISACLDISYAVTVQIL